MAMITKELYFKNYGGEITCGELEEYALAEIRNLYISEEFEDSDYFCGPYNWSSICGVYGIFTNLKGGEIQYDKVTPAYNKRYDSSIKKDGIYLLSKSLGKVFTSIELELEDEEEFDANDLVIHYDWINLDIIDIDEFILHGFSYKGEELQVDIEDNGTDKERYIVKIENGETTYIYNNGEWDWSGDNDSVLQERKAGDKAEIESGQKREGNTSSLEELENLAKDKSKAVRGRVAENVDTPVQVLEKLAVDEEGWVRQKVATNVNTLASMLEKLSTDKDERVRHAVARNNNTPISVLEKLAEDVNPSSFFDVSRPARLQLAQNENTPAPLLEKLWLDENISVHREVRKALAENMNTPVSVLEKLAEDKDEWVREAAREKI